MRVTCFFVSVAIMLAEQASALPIGGLPSLPVVHEGPLVSHAVATVQPLPVVGVLASNLLEDHSQGSLLSAIDLIGKEGLINHESTLGEITPVLERRQLLGIVGTLLGRVERVPLLGSLGSAAPVAEGVTSKVTSLNGSLSNVKQSVTQTTHILPVSSLTRKLPSILKRTSVVPVVGSLPYMGSIPGLKELNAVPGLNALPNLDTVPGYDKLQFLNNIPGLATLANMGQAIPESGLTDGLTKRSGGLPGVGQIPVLSSIPGINSLPGIASVPVVGSLPRLENLSGVEAIPLKDGMGSLTSLTSTLSIPNIFKRDTAFGSLPVVGSLPGISSLPSMPSLPGMGSMPSMPSLPGIGSLPSMPSLPGMGSLPSMPSVPGLSSLPSMSSVPGLGSLTSGGIPGMSSLGGLF